MVMVIHLKSSKAGIIVNTFPFAGFMVLMYIFETYLDIRQHAALKLPSLPKPLEGVVSQEKFEKSRAYSLDKRSVFFFHGHSFFQWICLRVCLMTYLLIVIYSISFNS